MVAQLVPSMRVSADPDGSYYINNVRVNGISAAEGVSLLFILGVLNGKVADFVFRRTAKPKNNNFFEANKQFIKHLPIPSVAEEVQTEIGDRAEELQRLHTEKRDTLSDIARRFQSGNVRSLPDSWLFTDLPTLDAIEETAPDHLDERARRAWERNERKKMVELRTEQLGQSLIPGATMDATHERGELRFFIDGVPVVERVFANQDEGTFILAQWKVIASTFAITERSTGKKLTQTLRKVSPTAPEPLRSQVIGLVAALQATEAQIATREVEMNQRLYELYGMTAEEVAMVERG